MDEVDEEDDEDEDEEEVVVEDADLWMADT